MKRIIPLLALLALALATLAFAAADAEVQTGPSVGQMAPDFHLQDQKGA